MTIKVERVAYGGWPNCYRLANGAVDLVATTDVGPRVIRFGFMGGPNEFVQFPDMLGKTGGDDWRIYGGHRFWHAPEDPLRTYLPDNGPVRSELLENGLRLIQPVEAATGLQKVIDLQLDPNAARVRVTHRMRNAGLWPVELAPWALSAMAPGGTAILPFPPRGSHPADLLPTAVLVLWPYSDMSDPRWTWGRQYVLLRQRADGAPQKIGAMLPDGWLGYANGGRLFVKTFQTVPGARYPDLGCSVETFTNESMLELETLGPFVNLAPNATVEHVERWHLFDGVIVPNDEAAVEAHVRPLVQSLVTPPA